MSMGVGGDAAAGTLPVNLTKPHHRNAAAGDELTEHRPRPYAGQLVGVPYQDQLAAGRQGVKQMSRQVDVHHGDFIHQDQVRIQGFRRGVGPVLPGHEL